MFEDPFKESNLTRTHSACAMTDHFTAIIISGASENHYMHLHLNKISMNFSYLQGFVGGQEESL